MFEVGASVVCTVLALNFHHRSPESYQPMTPFCQKILLEWLPYLICLQRPADFDDMFVDRREAANGHVERGTKENGKKTRYYTPLIDGSERSGCFKGRSAKEHCAVEITRERKNNVHLDFCKGSGGFRWSRRFRSGGKSDRSGRPLIAAQLTNVERLATEGPLSPVEATANTRIEAANSKEQRLLCELENGGDEASRVAVQTKPPLHVSKALPLRSTMDDWQFNMMMSELRVISNKIRKEEFIHSVRADWMFAAMVIDRICFITFTTFLVVCLLVLSHSAPHLFA